MIFNSGHGGTGVSESFDVSSVKTGETVTVQSTVTDEKGKFMFFQKYLFYE